MTVRFTNMLGQRIRSVGRDKFYFKKLNFLYYTSDFQGQPKVGKCGGGNGGCMDGLLK